MPQIGLDHIVYAKIQNSEGNEIYDSPKTLSRAITADISVEFNEAQLFSDDSLSDETREFKSGKLKLGTRDLPPTVISDLLGVKTDESGVLVYTDGDKAPFVAIGFRSKKVDGTYRYFWFYRVKFAVPSESFETKKDSITFKTPEIEGTIFARNKPDADGNHPWKAEKTSSKTQAEDTVIEGWFDSVYGGDMAQTEQETAEPASEPET